MVLISKDCLLKFSDNRPTDPYYMALFTECMGCMGYLMHLFKYGNKTFLFPLSSGLCVLFC